MRSELSHRERVRRALEHQETDRIPIAMVCAGINPPAYEALKRYLAQERGVSVEDYLRPLVDIAYVSPAYVGPALPPRTDIWGVRRAPVTYGEGAYDEIEFYPLADAADPADLARHRWPDTEWFDYSVLPEQIAAIQKEGPFCLMASNGNIFESSWYMRGFERMLLDLALRPEMVHAIFERVCDFYVQHFTRILSIAKGDVDLVFTADDIGGQNGLLMSLDMWSEHLKPYHQRLNRVIHGFGARVIYHSDGAVMEAVPGLIEMGVDVLQALQFDAKGMDPAALKAQYGDRLCFEGGVSVQHTLPFGTVDDVRREVRERIDVLGRNGGYILGPSHAIQAGTPPENVVAMFDTATSHPLPSGGRGR
jgi:uroporphyrinogen decarboxylase